MFSPETFALNARHSSPPPQEYGHQSACEYASFSRASVQQCPLLKYEVLFCVSDALIKEDLEENELED